MRNSTEIEKFGERLHQLRKEAGMTQSQLAFEAGVGTKTIYRIERGQQAATLDLIISLAKALNMSLLEFFKGLDIAIEE